MANPGPASSQTTNYLFNGDSSDGVQLAGSATELLGFHGVTPTVQQAAITALANDASGTAIATAVNAIITALEVKGLIAEN
jgi:hypothetical protein